MGDVTTTLPRRDQLHTTQQAAEALGVPASLIRKWAHRGQVNPAGCFPAPVRGGLIPLYRLDELEDLAKRYHANTRAGSLTPTR